MTFISRRALLGTAAVTGAFGAPKPAAKPRLLLLEAEAFENPGGWVLDQQVMDKMGSAYLLAHGMGTPVADARTTARVPAAGSWRVWVRTRDWVAPWNATGAPGRFQVLVAGKPLKPVFGTEGAQWHWQDGGVVRLQAGPTPVVLHDLTGFEGRCDSVLLADPAFVPPDGDGLAAFRREALGGAAEAAPAGEFDLIVVGGGMAGTTAAITAARLGLKVALIQDRPLLGGNNSSEIRVHLGGEIARDPYPALGGVVNELDSGKHGNAQPAANYDDERKLGLVKDEKNIRLFLLTRATGVEKSGNRVTAVLATDIRTGARRRFTARLVADCTGDAAIGYLAGADHRYGRESRAETGERLAPEKPDNLVMGTSVMWYSGEAGAPVAFPETPWAHAFNEKTCQRALRGDWDWETGQNRHQIDDFEQIRDNAFRAIYGNWSYQKNHASDKEKYANLRLEWVAFIGGKRESRRLLGDVILCEQDIEGQRAFPDASVTATWSIDLHYPKPDNTAGFPGHEFRSYAEFGKKAPYAIPYRCLYSRNIENLFMAGRNISVTHVALGTVRVMRTTGMMGEVVGMAAAVCRKHGITPRGVYQERLADLQALMKRGAAKGDLAR